jgi:hypothetical protein
VSALWNGSPGSIPGRVAILKILAPDNFFR